MRRNRTKRQVRLRRQLARHGTVNQAKTGWAVTQASHRIGHRTKHARHTSGNWSAGRKAKVASA